MNEITESPGYEPDQQPAAVEQPQPKLSPVQRLWMAFTSPGEVFADIGIKPSWILCLVVMVALGVLVQLAIVPHVDFEASIRERLGDRAAELSDEQIEGIVEQQQGFAKFGPIMALVIGPIAWAIMAAIFMVMLKIVGSEIDFQKTLSTALHSYWPPSLVASILMVVLIQRVDKLPQQELTNVVKASPGAFLSPDAPAWLSAAAGTLSVFNIWTVALLIIGFRVVGRLSTGKAAVAALVPWIVWLVGKAGVAQLIG
jgi:hypothetical protein